MMHAAENAFESPSRRQQFAAWFGVVVILGVIAWMATSALWNWFDNQAELNALEAKVSALQMRQEDPAPLLDLLAQLKKVPIAGLGYGEGATEDEARTRIEQAVSAILSAHQAQVLSFARLPALRYGPIRGLAFETTLTAPTSRVVLFVAAIENAQPTIIMRKLTVERRADGLADIMLRGEVYWVSP